MMTKLAPNTPDTCPLSKDFYLARQPILNRQQQLVAYELLFRSANVGTAGVQEDLHATASVIAHLVELGLEQVVGTRRAYINIDAAALFNDILSFLPYDNVVLEILETVEATPDVYQRVQAMKSAGFVFALDDVIRPSADVRRLMPLAQVIKIDIMDMPQDRLAALARDLRAPGRSLLAEKVETQTQFEQCKALGFDFFQGYYFAKPVVLAGKKLAPSELALTHILNLLEQDADNATIEHAIKHDAMLSINLLRLVNTPAAGARARIDSLSQALLVLGQQQLKRWLQILLFSKAGQGGQLDSPLLSLAIARARLVELLAERQQPRQPRFSQAGFTVGIMSLMDTLFAMPLTELLAKINVADDVRAALLHRRGSYGDMLTVAEEVERPGAVLAAALQRLALTAEQLHQLQLQAFAWANRVAQSG